MTAKEAYLLIEQLKSIFDVVRLVDAERTEVCRVYPDGHMEREPLQCFEVWEKDRRCLNCISAKVGAQHSRIDKYEFVNNEVFHITSKCLRVEDRCYALEIVAKTSDDTLFEAYGKETFVQTIESMNRKMYLDSMTDTYNRRYYDEQVKKWNQKTAMAMVDIDDFKKVNDTYGHSVGDEALKAVAKVLKAHVRNRDAVIRFGGDEFLMVFAGITQRAFHQRLEEARAATEQIRLERCPQLRLSLSIGGAYDKGTEQDLFELADRRLYQAKKTKNSVKTEESPDP